MFYLRCFMDWWKENCKKVLNEVGSSISGLDDSEVQKRFGKFGKNILRERRRKGLLNLILGQFNSLLVWILIGMAAFSFFLEHFVDAVVIMGIVFLNAGFGVFQEYKAESIIEKLKNSLKYKVMVLRNGKRVEVDSKFLVPGDIVLLDAGDRVLADCRVLESDGLTVIEAVLTGESFPIEKSGDTLKSDVVLADRKNMVYAGTSVVKGKATCVVVATGVETEFGKLADLVQTTEDEIMPLEKKIDDFSKRISLTFY